MRLVSDYYKDKIRSGETRNFLIKIDLTLADDTTLTLTEHDIIANSFKILTASSGDSTFDIGSAIIGKCEFSLINFDDRYLQYDFFNATAVVWVKLEGDSEYHRIGFYTVDEPNYVGSIIQIEMLDNMWLFDVPLADVNLSFPATILTAVTTICTYCGVTLADTTFNGYNFTISELPDKEMNCREFLQYVAMIGCNFCVMNSQGQLKIRWYNTPSIEEDSLDGGSFLTNTTPYSDGDTADGGNFTNYSSGDDYDGGSFVGEDIPYFTRLFTRNLVTDEITITGVKFIIDETEYSIGTEGYVLILENPLVNVSNVNAVLNLIWGVLGNFKMRGFSVTALPDIAPEVGDYVAISYKGNMIYSYLTSFTFTPSSCSAALGCEAPTRNLQRRYSKSVQTAVEIAKTKTNEIISVYDNAVQMMNAIAVNAMGAYEAYEEAPTGGRIYYLSNRPITFDDQGIKFVVDSTVFKITGDGFFVAQSAGERPSSTTFVNGYNTQTGQLVINVLDAIGINADWIKSGTIATNLITALDSTTTVGGKTIDAIAQEKADAAELAAENTAAQALAAQVAIYDADIADLQNQIDGNVTTWYYSGVPTLSNLPASQWTTTTDKDNHIGDIYYDSATGYAYRFMKSGNNYVWTKISDSDIEAALAEAQDAWDLADNKRRVFITQPTPPYDLGDLWVQGTSGDIMRCRVAKPNETSQSYEATDWIKASKYTDDSAVNALDNSLDQTEVFNRLIGGDTRQGIVLNNGKLYLRGDYLEAGAITVGGSAFSTNPTLVVKDTGNQDIVRLNVNEGIWAQEGTIGDLTLEDGELHGDGEYLLKDTKTYNEGNSSLGGGHSIITDLIPKDLRLSKPFKISVDYTVSNLSKTDTRNFRFELLQRSGNTQTTVAQTSITEVEGSYTALLDYSISNTDTYNYAVYVMHDVGTTKFKLTTRVYIDDVSVVSLSRAGIYGTFTGTVFGVGNFDSLSADTITVDNLQITDNGIVRTSDDDAYKLDFTPTLIRSRNSSTQYTRLDNSDASLRIQDTANSYIDLITGTPEINVYKTSSEYIRIKGNNPSIHIQDSSSEYLEVTARKFRANTSSSQYVEISDYPKIEAYADAYNFINISADDKKVQLSYDSTHYVIFQGGSNKNLLDQRGSNTYSIAWTSSDRRNKENIEDLDTELSKNFIDATETKQFKYKDSEGKHYGMIAQDVRELLDNLGETDAHLEYCVNEEDEYDPRNINYSEYIPHLINYVKDLRAELNRVKAELNELKEGK
jgi:hypothetical protein